MADHRSPLQTCRGVSASAISWTRGKASRSLGSDGYVRLLKRQVRWPSRVRDRSICRSCTLGAQAVTTRRQRFLSGSPAKQPAPECRPCSFASASRDRDDLPCPPVRPPQWPDLSRDCHLSERCQTSHRVLRPDGRVVGARDRGKPKDPWRAGPRASRPVYDFAVGAAGAR